MLHKPNTLPKSVNNISEDNQPYDGDKSLNIYSDDEVEEPEEANKPERGTSAPANITRFPHRLEGHNQNLQQQPSLVNMNN